MSASPKSIRFKAATLALIDAEMTRSGEPFGAVVERCVINQLGEAFEEVPAQVAPRKERAPKATPAPAQVPGVTTAAKLSERGVSMSEAMKRAGIAEYDPSAKRPQYVKGSAKGRGGR